MQIIRFAPFVMMLVADVFPGSCCGGARQYQGPSNTPTRPGLTIVNHSSVVVCRLDWAADRSQPVMQSLDNGANIQPGESKSVPFPAGKFMVRLLGCDGKVLMVGEDVTPNGQPVTIEYK